jgi:predicted DNA-binding transcriptional regulator AlpA
MTRYKIEPRLLSRADAARYLGISLSTFMRMHSGGELPMPLKIRKRVLWDKLELDMMIEAVRENLSKRDLR